MTTKEVIQHPNSTSIKHLALGFLAAVLLQHGIDVHEQIATISQFLSSDEAKGLLAAVIAIFSAVQNNFAHPLIPGSTATTTAVTAQHGIAQQLQELASFLKLWQNQSATLPTTVSATVAGVPVPVTLTPIASLTPQEIDAQNAAEAARRAEATRQAIALGALPQQATPVPQQLPAALTPAAVPVAVKINTP